jgi:hypothetical protein
MIGHAVLHRLTAAGLSVTLDGDRLKVSPASRLNDELRTDIRRHKPALIEVLQGALDPRFDDREWERIRELSQSLGRLVTDGSKQYQLWGITPRGAICFNGYVLRTLEFEEVTPAS